MDIVLFGKQLSIVLKEVSTHELDDYVKFQWMSNIDKKLVDISFFKIRIWRSIITKNNFFN